MSEVRRVKVMQITTDGCQYVMTILQHPTPLPRIGECVYYGCTLEIVDIIHHYQVDHMGHYGISHTEMIVQ